MIKAFSNNDPRYFKSIRVRFADSVFPGETLITEMWKESDTKIVFRCRVKERDKVVINNASIDLYTEIPAVKAKAKAAPPAAAAAVAAAVPAPTANDGKLVSGDIFVAIKDYLEKNPDLVGQVGTVFQFDLINPDSSWLIDVKNGKGSVTAGKGAADVTLTLSDEDFLAMTSGAADPQKLYFAGKLKIGGNVMASQKLTFLKKVDPKAAEKAIREARQAASGAPRPRRPRRPGQRTRRPSSRRWASASPQIRRSRATSPRWWPSSSPIPRARGSSISRARRPR